MQTQPKKLLIFSLITAIILTSICIGALVLRILNDLTGFNLDYFYPFCTSIYSNYKFGFTYRSILIEFGVNCFAIGVGILLCIFYLIPLRAISVNNKEPEEGSLMYKEKVQVVIRYEVLYVLAALVVVLLSIVMGGAVQYLIQGKNCTAIVNINNTILNYLDIAAGGVALLHIVLVIALCCQRQPLADPIAFKNSKQQSQEEEMSRKFRQEARGYLSILQKEKLQTQKGLLNYQQEIFKRTPYQYAYEQAKLSRQVDEESSYQYEEVQEVVAATISKDSPNTEKKEGKDASQIKEYQEFEETQNNITKTQQPLSPPRLVHSQKSDVKVFKASKQSLKHTPSKIIEQSFQEQKVVDEEKKEEQSQVSKQDIELDEEIKKILKVTLFKNFPLFNQAQPSEVEEHCPIIKFIERDENYEINRSDYKFKGKNKKSQIEKEQLVFSKKKRDTSQSNINNYEYQESESIRIERLQRFGSDWVQQRQKEQKERGGELSNRYRKRNGIQAIRSKYYM